MAERYQVRGRRIWDSETDTYSKLFESEGDAKHVIGWLTVDAVRLQFRPLDQWPQESDPVNHPDHYQGKVECIDAIEAALGDDGFVAHCRGTAMKYLYRAGRKGESVEDLRKAAWYLNRAIKTLEK